VPPRVRMLDVVSPGAWSAFSAEGRSGGRDHVDVGGHQRRRGGTRQPAMDKAAVVKVGAAASASVCILFGGVVLAQYIVAKKKRAGKKTRIIEMVSGVVRAAAHRLHRRNSRGWVEVISLACSLPTRNVSTMIRHCYINYILSISYVSFKPGG